MPAIISTSQPPSQVPGQRSWPLLLVAGLAGGVVAATVGLWVYFGTTVFFEMVRTGWIACF